MLLNHGLLLLLLIGSAVQSLAGSKVKKNFCDGEEFRSILEGIQLPSCLAANKEDASKPARNCSIIQHFARRAQEQDQSLDTFMSRVTVLIFAHSEFMEELTVPNNPALEIASEMERHNSYIGVTKCLKSANSACQRLRIACTGGYVSKFVFLISGHCSQNFGCSLIENKEKERPTTLLNMLQYVHFRMVERQAYIAKELGELRLTTSTGTEYLIQSELDDSNGKQLTSGAALPVAVFSAGPVINLAYYQQLAWFLEAALTLKSSFAFHIIATPLSYIEKEADRPLYRWKIREHESFLALYTRQICSSDAKWVFSCKPLMKIANEMLVPEQYSAFLLHGVLAAHSLPGTSYPTYKSTAVSELSDFVHSTASYVLAVMPVDELLTDPMISLEMMDSLTSYLGSSFSITYYPVVLNKATALQILKDVDTGLNLQEVFERPCYFMRFPNGAFAVLKNDEPIATLDSTVRHIAQEGSYQIIIQSSREVFNTDVAELPEKLIKSGHISGEMARADEDTKDLVDEIRVSNQTDAFVEQLKFRDIYNVSGVLVVESDDKLMSNFFELAGKDKPWMVLFTVSWSPLCKAARSIWASVGDCARRLGFPDVQLVKIDCFEGNEICQKLGVLSYPRLPCSAGASS
ncbi:hypothetical protein BOX15_Mlig015067g1 [Macrostomum lignano]|uniref:Thioredoxin domain-containing protein n=1 Tax=Macrostomum lignano TaxID=282301 RepID=A0A267GDI1_9PLAT|nr:hypothetical protein BOX15_Mlig015067g1 [Macrostomum lignano]